MKLLKKALMRGLLLISKNNYMRVLGVKHGKDCKIVALNGGTFGSEPYLVSLGDHVEVSFDVRFITHDGSIWVARGKHPKSDVIGPISIGNNVFIGAKSIILPNTNIGNNVIIGAGSIVKGNYPSGEVYAGIPAKRVKATDSYIAEKLNDALPTKLLSKKEKKKFLINYFNRS